MSMTPQSKPGGSEGTPTRTRPAINVNGSSSSQESIHPREVFQTGPRPIRLQRLVDTEGTPFIEISSKIKAVSGGNVPSNRHFPMGNALETGELAAGDMTGIEITAPTVTIGMTKQKKSFSKRLTFVLRVVITLALVVLILRGVSWSEVISVFTHVHLTDLLVGLCLGTLGVIFSAYLWHRLVQAENIRADMSHLTSLYLIGVAFSNFLPTSMGGDALKAFYVGRDSGNMTGSASAVLMSRITGFFGMLLVAFPVLIFLHNEFDGVLIERFLLLCLFFLAGFGSAFVLGAFLPQIQGKLLKGVWAKWASNKLVLKVFETGIALTQSLKKPGALFQAIGFGFLFWVANCLNYYEYAVALGVHTPFRFYLLAVPFIGIVGALPISISGYGVREGLVVYLYSTIHVPASIALAVVLLMDIQRLFFSFVGGLLFLTMENKAVRPTKVAATASAGKLG